MRLTALRYGATLLSEAQIFLGGRKERMYPISLTIYLIETEGRRILVDAGCDTMPGFPLTEMAGPVAVLREMGYAPEDITDVILTHSHHDHAEGAVHFPHALFTVQTEEYPKCERYLPTGARVRLFGEELTVCENVVVRRVGGHTAGSSVVELHQGETVYVLCGDECYSPLCLTRGIPTGASRCPEKSRAFIETYRHPPYRVLVAHDPVNVSERVF